MEKVLFVRCVDMMPQIATARLVSHVLILTVGQRPVTILEAIMCVGVVLMVILIVFVYRLGDRNFY